MDGKELITTYKKQYQAHLAKDKLENEGIATTILEHEDPVSSTDGLYEIFVAIEHADKAREIIAAINE